MRLDRDSILKAEDLETREVDVPEWGGSVLVRGLTGAERDAYEESCLQERPRLDAQGRPIKGQTEMVRSMANLRAKLVARCVVDDNGQRLFTDQDANALGRKSAAAIDRLFEVASELSRLSPEDVEELAGNSPAASSGDSLSSSPEPSAAPSLSF